MNVPDFCRAADIEQRYLRGETLTPQEQAHMDAHPPLLPQLCCCGCGDRLVAWNTGEHVRDGLMRRDCYDRLMSEEIDKHPLGRRHPRGA